jgi:hypothetical protein
LKALLCEDNLQQGARAARPQSGRAFTRVAGSSCRWHEARAQGLPVPPLAGPGRGLPPQAAASHGDTGKLGGCPEIALSGPDPPVGSWPGPGPSWVVARKSQWPRSTGSWPGPGPEPPRLPVPLSEPAQRVPGGPVRKRSRCLAA